MSSKSSKAPGSGGKPAPKKDEPLVVPLSEPVKTKTEEGEDLELDELRLVPLAVRHLKGVPMTGLTLGDLLEIGFRMAGIDAPEGSPRSAKNVFRKTAAADLDPIVEFVENSLGAYHLAAEAFDIESVDHRKPYTVKLERPAKWAGEDIRELVLQPLTAGHLWDSPAGTGLSIYETSHLAGRQAGVSGAVIDGLGMVDAGRVNAAVAGFLFRFRKTGSEPSGT